MHHEFEGDLFSFGKCRLYQLAPTRVMKGVLRKLRHRPVAKAMANGSKLWEL